MERRVHSPLPQQAVWVPTSSWPQEEEEMKHACVCLFVFVGLCVWNFTSCCVLIFLCVGLLHNVLSHAVRIGLFCMSEIQAA